MIGISADKLEDQQKFTDRDKLNFPLLADSELKVTKTLGVLMPANKKLAQRSTFIIDKQGVIRKIYPKVGNAGGHAEEVLKYVKENLAEKK